MTNIAQHIQELQASLPKGVTLVAVSKFHPVEALQEAYDAGQRVFGESRAQELVVKAKVLPKDIEWHFIGPLQSNKVKDIAPFIHLIHSIDSLKLLQEVNKQAAKHGRSIRVLLEIHVATEETKHGFGIEECRELVQHLPELPNVRISGIMGMATQTDDEQQIRQEFHTLHALHRIESHGLQGFRRFHDPFDGHEPRLPAGHRRGKHHGTGRNLHLRRTGILKLNQPLKTHSI